MRDATRCVQAPAIDADGFASLTVPVQRASTITFPDAPSFARRHERGHDGYTYGLYGTPTTRALEAQIAMLEGAAGVALTPSGQAAVTTTMLALLKPGDHLLIPDSVYPPVRAFADGFLAALGVRTTYYDPLIGAGITAFIEAATRLVWVESPGSGTFEVQDVPAIVAAAHARGLLVACDNSWATPLLFRPLAAGADLSILAVTKYLSGHSDLLMGSIAAPDKALLHRVKDTTRILGLGVSPDDCSLALRGLQTLAVRLRHVGAAAIDLALWLERQRDVERVLHPALPGCPGHPVWERDFKGASGVFAVVLAPAVTPRLDAALGRLDIFRIGASWGGTHSLIAPMDVSGQRTVVPWTERGPLLRLSIGLEDPEDLKADLARFLAALTSD
ncbi:cystathionine beta-lyase [Chelatococcus sp. SYSU_G07232]|uniref:Cystathionine beta-lyase n=1 Tax=Chelatococcus albus TaxID=3047466 RepID=A0ABT7AJ96_9HYPH|nr:cystathionine beta-lyase [Chelatococcus sp. SYSU_G07232]MDJ1158666.1 cystathionine beta-lyase [Chelatococcus sp. SYSU_G07232]